MNRITSFISNPAKPSYTQQRFIYCSRSLSTSSSTSSIFSFPKQFRKVAMAPHTHRRSSTVTPVTTNLLPGFAFAFEYVVSLYLYIYVLPNLTLL